MKKSYSIACLLSILLLSATFSSFAQEDAVIVKNGNEYNDNNPYDEKGFKKENIFTGGNITASFGTGFTVLGASPMLGYKLNNYFDAGVVLNYVYTGARDYWAGGGYADKVRQHTFGPGVFMRAYPVPFLFAQAQLEQNFIHEKYVANGQNFKYNANAPSLLLGAGFASGRNKGGTTFYYLSLLFDVLKNRNSPYINIDRNGAARIQPVIRAGFNIGLFQGRFGRYQEYE